MDYVQVQWSRSIALSGALYLRNNSASRMAVSTSLTCSDSDWELTIVGLMFLNSDGVWGAPGSGRSLSQEILDRSGHPFGIKGSPYRMSGVLQPGL